jgi:response regulator RpfG family c-di-GMP phosphodiesterase
MKKPAIICVDDEKIILSSLKSLLRGNFGDKYTIEIAESGEEALELVNELNEDEVDTLVVISDWLMPSMKGDEFLAKLHGKFPRIVKIMLTGQADPKSVENAKKNANLYKYLAKPWKEDELVKVIEQGLKSY